MYNKFFKEDFLETITTESTNMHFRALFNKTSDLENDLEKDLYAFTTAEIETLLYSFGASSIKTLQTYINECKKYTQFAILKGVKSSNINLYDLFPVKNLEKYVATYKLKFIKKEDLMLDLEAIHNQVDYALFLSLFYGIGGDKYSELSNLTIHDVNKAFDNKIGDKYELVLRNKNNDGITSERTLLVNSKLLNELERAYRQEIYEPKNGTSSATRNTEILDGEYIFRNVNKNNSVVQMDYQGVYRKANILKLATEGKISSVSTIINSGIVYHLSTLAKNGKIDYSDILHNMEVFTISINKNSPINSAKAYFKKYKNALESLYNVTLDE